MLGKYNRKINEIWAQPSESSKSGIEQMWKHNYHAIGKELKYRFLQSSMRNQRKKMDYVKEGTFRVSFTEERTYTLSFEEYKDFGREENERRHSKKKEQYVQSFTEEAKLK